VHQPVFLRARLLKRVNGWPNLDRSLEKNRLAWASINIFHAIREGRVSVVTDEIKTFTEDGLLLKSGQHLNADIIVTATGLVPKLISSMQLVVDGASVALPKKLVYKGMMFSDVPNLAFAIGYTNASWTLKCDLTSSACAGC
jgi:monooxygenase